MRGRWLKIVGVAGLGLALAAPGWAAGFGIFEQGTKAMGMGGAFTAQADDLSAMFHNAGGLAFIDHGDVMGGITWFQGTSADFEGAAPFPGPSARAEQELISQPLVHLYAAKPIGAAKTWAIGLGINNPFGLVTEWQNPATFPGRFLSTKAELRVFDFNPTVAWRAGNFGIGFGAVARVSDVELQRRVGTLNPFSNRIVDVAALKLESDVGDGYGWNVGILHRFNNSFSWGLSYRSKVDVDYEGDARLTQISTGNAAFDAVIRSRLPFDRNLPVATGIDFPDMASLGLAFALSPNLLLETDANWTGWSSFQEVDIDFTSNDLPDATIAERWDDAFNYRAGLRWNLSPTSQLRFGYIFDETPQPEESVSPLLPDADRNDFAIGYGHDGVHDWDVALLYVKFKDRERHRSFADDPNDFFGTYSTEAVLVAFTFTW